MDVTKSWTSINLYDVHTLHRVRCRTVQYPWSRYTRACMGHPDVWACMCLAENTHVCVYVCAGVLANIECVSVCLSLINLQIEVQFCKYIFCSCSLVAQLRNVIFCMLIRGLRPLNYCQIVDVLDTHFQDQIFRNLLWNCSNMAEFRNVIFDMFASRQAILRQ